MLQHRMFITPEVCYNTGCFMTPDVFLTPDVCYNTGCFMTTDVCYNTGCVLSHRMCYHTGCVLLCIQEATAPQASCSVELFLPSFGNHTGCVLSHRKCVALNSRKRQLLKQVVLPSLATNRSLQRLLAEYLDMLNGMV